MKRTKGEKERTKENNRFFFYFYFLKKTYNEIEIEEKIFVQYGQLFEIYLSKTLKYLRVNTNQKMVFDYLFDFCELILMKMVVENW